MATVIFMKDMNQVSASMNRVATEAPKNAILAVTNTDGKALYKKINDSTRVKTGRLKRGNILEMNATGFRYFNNVPYAGHMNTGPRGNRFMEIPFYNFKNIAVKRVNEEVAKSITLLFKSF